MSRSAFLKVTAVFTTLAAGGCSLLGGDPDGVEREPVQWQLAEQRYRDIPGAVQAGNGWVDPEASTLVFLPLYREDLDYEVAGGVELLRLLPGREAQVGETVTAVVRMKAASPESAHRITIKPTRMDVRILGSTERMVRGAETASFQFTSYTAQRGGISLDAEELR